MHVGKSHVETVFLGFSSCKVGRVGILRRHLPPKFPRRKTGSRTWEPWDYEGSQCGETQVHLAPTLTEAIRSQLRTPRWGWTFPCPRFLDMRSCTDVATAFPKALRCATPKQKDIWFTELFLIQVVLKFSRCGMAANPTTSTRGYRLTWIWPSINDLING